VDIATGNPESHPTPLPYTPGFSPATARPAVTAGQQSPQNQGGVRDTAGERLGQLAAYESDIAAAMSAGMAAENDRRSGYAADIAPRGAMYGDQPQLPEVPAYATPPASAYGSPWPGDEPVPGSAS
jgi:hypothetical protein